MGKIRLHILIISSIAVFITLMGFLIFYPVPSPPIGAMGNALSSLSLARRSKADTYSATLYQEAKSCYDSAMKYWKKENKKFIYSRNFGKVVMFAELSAKKALSACDDSENNASSLNDEIKQKINDLNKVDANLIRRFSVYPLSSEMRKNISIGEMLLTEAEIAWEKGDYVQAGEKINQSEKLLVPAYNYADANLRSYFRSFPEWKKLADTTIAESRVNQDYSIIVDKFSRKVFVYLNGEVHYEYSAELGRNWVGDKRIRGDKATPEGRYKITKKFDSDSTTYYKALLLNYPNDEDTAVFEAAIEKGALPRSAKIGGMIEIHGNGGKGSDWTAGCIAITDREMDSLFKIVKIGTPVTIVGSMRDFRHVLNK